MTAPIHASWVELLLSLPETGMGYQIVEVRETGSPPIPAMILNADHVIERHGQPMVVRERPAVGESERLARVSKSAPRGIEVQVLGAGETTLDRRRSGGAADAVPEMSESEDEFLRYSAFRNDRRILSDGSVLPGTYATTFADGRAHVKTGTQAVRRYALPNPDPAVHEFELKPPGIVQIRRGIAQPAFSQPGGGVEIIFDTGAPARTLISHRELPP